MSSRSTARIRQRWLRLSVGLGALICGGTISALAMPDWLGDADIASVVEGATLTGRYANGRTFTEQFGPDGRVAYQDGLVSIGGRWSVTNGTLCTIYDTDPAGGCFRVQRVGANCFEFYFAARTEAAAPGKDGDGPHWTAQGWRTDDAPSCDDAGTV